MLMNCCFCSHEYGTSCNNACDHDHVRKYDCNISMEMSPSGKNIGFDGNTEHPMNI